MYSIYDNEILYMWRQCDCHDVQNFVVIGWIYLKLECSIFWLNFEFDRNTVRGMAAWSAIGWKVYNSV